VHEAHARLVAGRVEAEAESRRGGSGTVALNGGIGFTPETPINDPGSITFGGV